MSEHDKTGRHGKRPRSEPGFWNDAQIGREQRMTGDGVPLEVAWDDFTPVQPVIDLIDTLDVPEDMKVLARSFWGHTANLEMRMRNAIANGKDVRPIRAEISRLNEMIAEGFADIRGINGDNGKIGRLGERLGVVAKAVDAIYSRAWWAFTVAVGAIGAAIVKLLIVGRAYGELETQVRVNRDRVQTLEAVVFKIPLPQPEKAPTP